MLSLDISAAYPNSSHLRLLYILQQKGFPRWLINIVQGFLTNCTTSLHFSGYQSPAIPIPTGLPQGSPLSPILFLLFAADLLFKFEQGPVRGSGFVDDTNLLAFSSSAALNCRNLERAHEQCLEWARRHGVQFSPEKYKLVHFTRRRTGTDLTAAVRIQGFNGAPCEGLRVLGVWVDNRLTYRPHIRRTVEKANLLFSNLSRIGQSTWGLSFRQSRLIYTTVVRPTLTYGAPVWSQSGPQGTPTCTLLQPLQMAQREALRRATGAYRATATRIFENEAAIPPIDLYIRSLSLRYRARSDNNVPLRAFLAQSRRAAWGRRSRPPEDRFKTAWRDLCDAGLTPTNTNGALNSLERWDAPPGP